VPGTRKSATGRWRALLRLLFRVGCETLTRGKAMRTILGLNLVCLLATPAFAQDRNFPAGLGAGLPPLNSSGPPPGLNYGTSSGMSHGGFPWGDDYGYGFDGYAPYGYPAPYSNI